MSAIGFIVDVLLWCYGTQPAIQLAAFRNFMAPLCNNNNSNNNKQKKNLRNLQCTTGKTHLNLQVVGFMNVECAWEQ